jgi:colanic acid biosynthesis glycosyl transferase WcaI
MVALERLLISRFSIVSTVSPAMAAKLEAKGISKAVQLFPNWVDTEFIFPMNQESPLRHLIGGDRSFIALYSGNLGRKQGIEMLVAVAEHLKEIPDVRLVICGDGVSREMVRAAASRLPNLSLFPLWPSAELNALLNAADVHLLPQRDQVADLVMPSKLGGMLSSGRPIIAAADPTSQLAREIVDCGILVPSGDAAAMAQAILDLRGEPRLRAQLGAEARQRAIARWSKTRILEAFERHLDCGNSDPLASNALES